MKVLVDTSIWIEFLKNNHLYFSVLRNLLENQNILALECVFGELLQGSKNTHETDVIISYWNNLPHVVIDNLFIVSGQYASTNKLISKGIGLIDAAIIYSAKQYEAKVWSLDKKLLSFLKKEEIFFY